VLHAGKPLIILIKCFGATESKYLDFPSYLVVSINFISSCILCCRLRINISILAPVCLKGWWEAAGDISSLRVVPARLDFRTLLKLTIVNIIADNSKIVKDRELGFQIKIS